MAAGFQTQITVTSILTFAILSQIFLFFYLHTNSSAIQRNLIVSNVNYNWTGHRFLERQIGNDTVENYWRSRYLYQRGRFTVLTNYVQGSATVEEFETVTLVTHATVDYLENVLELVHFWFGPISLTVYAPGTDFDLTLTKIAHFRACSEGVKLHVSFHVFFETEFLPPLKSGSNFYDLRIPDGNCVTLAKRSQARSKVNFLHDRKLLYPINVARNIGQEQSRTQFVLVSDIELFPNPPDLIPKFLDLLRRRTVEGKSLPREVFVLPPFELSKGVKFKEIPRSKVTLLQLLTKKRPLAFPFHYYACFLCHRIPQYWNWTHPRSRGHESRNLNVFHSSPYLTTSAWEPFYIGSRLGPPYDEGLFRENALNKVIQAAILCHSNYTFHVLDNAFLVHKPGLKYGKTFKKDYLKVKGIKLSQRQILPLQYRLYGRKRNGCWQINSTKPL